MTTATALSTATSTANASQRLGLGLLGALLAGGLLLAACSAPDDHTRAHEPGDAVLPHRGVSTR
ncbi:hypothetical protein ABZZ17_16035 [Streptomyces sp. NPDC006512]|uniref:hypothetical protein n=1 Tax=Streptomyces sp. NPDC006512 TaxID=3154307 RepID=UPI0033B909E0